MAPRARTCGGGGPRNRGVMIVALRPEWISHPCYEQPCRDPTPQPTVLTPRPSPTWDLDHCGLAAVPVRPYQVDRLNRRPMRVGTSEQDKAAADVDAVKEHCKKGRRSSITRTSARVSGRVASPDTENTRLFADGRRNMPRKCSAISSGWSRARTRCVGCRLGQGTVGSATRRLERSDSCHQPGVRRVAVLKLRRPARWHGQPRPPTRHGVRCLPTRATAARPR